MGVVANLIVRVGADIEGFEKKFASLEKTANRQASKLAGLGSKLTAGLTLPLIGMGGAALAAAMQLDNANDQIRISTGKSGKELDDFGRIARKVFATVPVGAGEAATALGDLHARTGLTGHGLETMSVQMLNLSRITKTEIKPLIADTTRVFGDWSISTDKQSGSLDYLFKTSQATGMGISSLSGLLVQFGAPLRQMGFDFETSAAMIGKFEKEGVNAELVLGSLRIGLNKLSQAGEEPPQAFRRIVEGIKNVGSTAQANTMAATLFGAKAGPDMAAAIREGRFEVDKLVDQLRKSPETINAAAKATDGLKERFTLLKNQAVIAIEPIGVRLMDALERLVPVGQRLAGVVTGLVEKFSSLPRPIQSTALGLIAATAAIGPLLWAGSVLVSTYGALAGAAVWASKTLGLSTVAKRSAGFAAASAAPQVTFLSTAMGILQKSVLLVGAAFAGWQMGKWISDMAPFGRQTLTIGESFEYAFTRAGNYIRGIKGVTAADVEATIVSRRLAHEQKNVSEQLGNSADAVNRLQRQLTGSDLAQEVSDLSGALQRVGGQSAAPDVLKRAAEKAAQLKAAGADLNPELEALLKKIDRGGKGGEAKKSPLQEALDGIRQSAKQLLVDAQAWSQRVTELGGITKAPESAQRGLHGALEAVIAQYGSLKAAGLSALEGLFSKTDALVGKTAAQAAAMRELFAGLSTNQAKRLELQLLSANALGAGGIGGLATSAAFAAQAGMVVDESMSHRPAQLAAQADFARFVQQSMKGGPKIPVIGTPVTLSGPPKQPGFINRAFGSVSQFGGDVSGTIMAALTGGGSVTKSLGALFGGKMTGQLGEMLSGAMGKAAKAGTGFLSGGLGKLLGGAAGAALPGIGALVGPLLSKGLGKLGGLLGIGPSKKEIAAKETTASRDEFLKSVGGVEQLKKMADDAGISVSKLLSTKQPKEFTAEVEKLNKAIEAKKQRWEGVAQAVDGVNARAEALMGRVSAGGTGAQPEFERLGQFATAAFAGSIREGKTAMEAFTALSPTLDVLAAGVKEYGLQGTEAINRLLGMRGLVTVHKAEFEALAANQQMLKGFGDAGLMTRDLFVAFGQDTAAQFAAIEAKGGDVAKAMALSQPILQQLWEGQQKYGAVTDEATAAMLRQAEEQGLVGAHMKDVNSKILDVLLAIGDALGAKIPNALRTFRSVTDSEGGHVIAKGLEIEDAWKRVADRGIRNPMRDAFMGIVDDAGRAAHDMQREFDGISVRIPVEVDEPSPGGSGHGTSQGGGAAAAGAGRGGTAVINIDGHTIARIVVPHLPDVYEEYGVG